MMRFSGFTARMYLHFIGAMLAVVASSSIYSSCELRRFREGGQTGELQRHASMLTMIPAIADSNADPSSIDAACKEIGNNTGLRITVMAAGGHVVGDSQSDPATMDNHLERPEMRKAMEGGIGVSTRFSDTTRRRMLYVAAPFGAPGNPRGVVRVSVAVENPDPGFASLRSHMLASTALAAALFAVVAAFLSRRITGPIASICGAARRLSSGDLAARCAVPADTDLKNLADAFNGMARQLGERMETIARQHNELTTVLESMSDGVLAVDAAERVIEVNRSAAALLDIDPAMSRGRSIQEVARNPEMQNLVAATLRGASAAEETVIRFGTSDRFLRVTSAPLVDRESRTIGAVVVFSDVTRMKKLETVRQEFAANASHELKTPVTAIRGCVETMKDSSLTPEETRSFLDMLDRHSVRLDTLVNDLLNLSRIEHDAGTRSIAMEPARVRDILQKACDSYAERAGAKNMSILLECPDALSVNANPGLLEEAIGNLLDNAIRYSGSGSPVRVEGRLAGPGNVELLVKDEGPGIEAKHLDRIWERFYRVDPARSRSLGGTGLGLSIVKNIAVAHGGKVRAESEPGKGSKFVISMPGRRAETWEL